MGKQHKQRVPPTPDELVLTAEDGLHYEIKMFYASGLPNAAFAVEPLRISDEIAWFVLHNARVEALPTHFRCLAEFLWLSPSPKHDDVRAEDYFHDPEKWRKARPEWEGSAAETLRRRADKEVAHLTIKRTKIDPKDKPWDFNASSPSTRGGEGQRTRGGSQMENRFRKYVQSIIESVRRVEERDETWATVAPNLAAKLRKVAEEANVPGSSIGLTINEHPSPYPQLILSFGKNRAGRSVDEDGQRLIVEEGAGLMFARIQSGRILVSFIKARLDKDGPFQGEVIAKVEPEELNDVQRVDGYVEEFLRRALNEHWSRVD